MVTEAMVNYGTLNKEHGQTTMVQYESGHVTQKCGSTAYKSQHKQTFVSSVCFEGQKKSLKESYEGKVLKIPEI